MAVERPGGPPALSWRLPARGRAAEPGITETITEPVGETVAGTGPETVEISRRPRHAAAVGEDRPATVEALITTRGEALMRLAYLLTGSRADAEDLFQETLVDAHRKWDMVSGSSHPYAYVRAMMTNRHTSSQRRMWHGERPTDPAEIPAGVAAAPDPTHRVDSDDALWQLLLTLPDRMRTILVLRYFEDLDDAEIARTLGIGVSTVRATASRALARLREGGDLG